MYITVDKNPITNLEENLNGMLKKWLQRGFIPKHTYLSLFLSDSILPKIYGLPKIHKTSYPYRIIISSINTALYPLASFLQKIISNSLILNDKHVKNSFDLYRVLSDKKISNTDILISLDVSLFINIPQDLTIECISNRWTLIKKNINIPMVFWINSL